MADISDVHTSDIKDLYNRLENLPCMSKKSRIAFSLMMLLRKGQKPKFLS